MSETESAAVESRSEFGAGLVVCLVKFSEHLANWAAQRYMDAAWWAKLTPGERDAQAREAAKYPFGDAARRLAHAKSVFFDEAPSEERLSRALAMWANGASDHFYDLDEEKAPPPLGALASLTLSMGHGFTGAVYGERRYYVLDARLATGRTSTLRIRDAQTEIPRLAPEKRRCRSSDQPRPRAFNDWAFDLRCREIVRGG